MNFKNKKSAQSEEMQTLRAGCIVRWRQKFRHAADLPEDAGRPKFN